MRELFLGRFRTTRRVGAYLRAFTGPRPAPSRLSKTSYAKYPPPAADL